MLEKSTLDTDKINMTISSVSKNESPTLGGQAHDRIRVETSVQSKCNLVEYQERNGSIKRYVIVRKPSESPKTFERPKFPNGYKKKSTLTDEEKVARRRAQNQAAYMRYYWKNHAMISAKMKVRNASKNPNKEVICLTSG